MVALASDLCAPWIGFDEVHRLQKYSALSEAQVAPYLMPASEVCFKLSGREWRGICPVVGLRPCRQTPRDYHALMPLASSEWQQAALWWGMCGCGGQPWMGVCECGVGIYTLDLAPFTPVATIDEIRVDGQVVDPTLYGVLEWRYLTRTDGQLWPSVQRMELPDTALQTFAIDLHYGQPAPEDAQLAAATLAGEMALAMNPGLGTCVLPDRIQTVVRQGITYVIADPQAYLDAGRTGIYLIDLWLRATNPKGITSKATLSYPGQVGLPGRLRTS